MEQVIIRVKILKTKIIDGIELKTVECINKDIRDCPVDERKQFYNSQSKGQIVNLLELYVKDEKGQM